MTEKTSLEPNVFDKPDLILKLGKKNLFVVIGCLIFPLVLFLIKMEFFLMPVLSLNYILHVVFLLLAVLFSILVCLSYFEKSPNLIVNTQGIYYKRFILDRKRWRHLNWTKVQSGYLKYESPKGTELQIVFTTKENKLINIGISVYDVSEIEIMDVIEKYSVIKGFGFLRDL